MLVLCSDYTLCTESFHWPVFRDIVNPDGFNKVRPRCQEWYWNYVSVRNFLLARSFIFFKRIPCERFRLLGACSLYIHLKIYLYICYFLRFLLVDKSKDIIVHTLFYFFNCVSLTHSLTHSRTHALTQIQIYQ